MHAAQHSTAHGQHMQMLPANSRLKDQPRTLWDRRTLSPTMTCNLHGMQAWACAYHGAGMESQQARLAAHYDLAGDNDVDPLAHGLLRINGGDLMFALLEWQCRKLLLDRCATY